MVDLEYLVTLANAVLDRCDSTNNIAKLLAENHYPHGTWVSTRIQESGRGRLGRKWESLEGNLFLSIIARVADKTLWSWVPLATAVATIRCLDFKYPGLNFQIKWPNDLFLAGQKLGGILCEGATTRTQSYIIIGIGLNCLHEPEGLDQKTTSLTSVLNRGPIVADDLREDILKSVLREIDGLISKGPFYIQQVYEIFSAFPTGTEIQWGAPPQSGIVEKLGTSAELVVKVGHQSTSLFAEDVKIKKKEAPKGLGDL